MHITNFDPRSEELRPLGQYRSRLPPGSNGNPISKVTLWRWSVHGLGGHRLKTVKIGHRRFTSDLWVWLFMNRENPEGCKEGCNKR